MAKKQVFEIEIDKLTRSIENAVSGDSFKTEVLRVSDTDIKKLKKSDWLFDWKSQAKITNTEIYKLIISESPIIIQGLISLQDRQDHIFMPLIESAKFNKGQQKIYIGVPGNLVAFACKLSFTKGYDGYVSFESKSKLKEQYKKTLAAKELFGNFMVIETFAALKLINQYFPEMS
jgi:hypothetical protein